MRDKERSGVLGIYAPTARSIEVQVQRVRSPAERDSFLLHEMAHALDAALGDERGPLSQSPEWVALWEEGMAALEAGEANGILTSNCAIGPDEMFADYAAIFLRTDVNESDYGIWVTTRADLKERSEKGYEMVERVFAELIPAKLAEPGLPSRLRELLGVHSTARLQPVLEDARAQIAGPDLDERFLGVWRLLDAAEALRSQDLVAEASGAVAGFDEQATTEEHRGTVVECRRRIEYAAAFIREHPDVS
jgi:hypothetical protein